MKVLYEITPVAQNGFFVVLDYPIGSGKLDYPLHSHPEFEINLIIEGQGSRTVGDSIEDIPPVDLALLGPNLYHCWYNYPGKISRPHVVTIQFDQSMLPEKILNSHLMQKIKKMLENSDRGICFRGTARDEATKKIIQLTGLKGFEQYIQLLDLLNFLAESDEYDILASANYSDHNSISRSRRIKTVFAYIERNYTNEISMKEVAGIINMSESAFSHFFKKRTNQTFTRYLNNIRLGHASRQLIETTDRISEVCFSCGFSNISYFNRLFIKKYGLTPKDYRRKYFEKEFKPLSIAG